MSYVPHTDAERGEMLKAIGVADMAGLFPDVPARVRFPKLDLPPPASELDIAREMRTLGARNIVVDPSLSFLGAGVYHHFRPAEVDFFFNDTATTEIYTLSLHDALPI